MNAVDITYEQSAPVEYDIVDNGKVIETVTSRAQLTPEQEQLAQGVVARKLAALQAFRKRVTGRKKMLAEKAAAKKKKNRKKNTLAKASRKRNR
jgi:predicted phage tail protein